MNTPKFKRSSYILNDKWLSLRADTFDLPTGGEFGPYYVIESKDCVHIIAVDQDGCLVITDHYRYATNCRVFELPCGEIDPSDASVEAAAKRELLEESGFEARKIEVVGDFFANPARTTSRVFTVICRDLALVQEPKYEVGEIMTIQKASITQLFELIKCGKFLHGLHLASLFQALPRLTELGLCGYSVEPKCSS